MRFVGLGNYAEFSRTICSARRCSTHSISCPLRALGNLMSLLVALGLNSRPKANTFQGLLLSPDRSLSRGGHRALEVDLQHEFGLLNHYLAAGTKWRAACTWPVSLEADSLARRSALRHASLVLMSVWWGAGGGMLIYLAGSGQSLKAITRRPR